MKQHICHINTTFVHRAGSARRTFRILRHLVEEGYEVSLVVGRDFDAHPDWSFEGISVHRIPSLVKYVDPPKDCAALYRLIQLLKTIRPDLVHTHLAKAGFLGRLAAGFIGIPLVVHTVHGPTFSAGMGRVRSILFMLLERLAARFCNCFVFVGQELADHYINSRICDRSQCAIIRTGRFSMATIFDVLAQASDPTVRKELCKDPTSFLMLTVGRVVPPKQQEHSIYALSLIRQNNINAELLIAGEAFLKEELSHRSHLMGFAAKLEVSDYVHFLGFYDNVLKLMSEADVMLLTSRYEGLPNVIVEAALAGCPVLSYEVTGVREVAEMVGDGLITAVAVDDLATLVSLLTKRAQEKEAPKSCLSEDNVSKLNGFSVERMLLSKTALYHSLFDQKRV